MRIKPGCGYWNTTHYPIGGCFARAPRKESAGQPIKQVLQGPGSCDGYVLVELPNGDTAAVKGSHLDNKPT